MATTPVVSSGEIALRNPIGDLQSILELIAGKTTTSTKGPTSGTSTIGPTSGTSTVGPSTATSTIGPTSGYSTIGPTSGYSNIGPTSGYTEVGPTSGTTTIGPTSGFSTTGPSTTSSKSNMTAEQLQAAISGAMAPLNIASHGAGLSAYGDTTLALGRAQVAAQEMAKAAGTTTTNSGSTTTSGTAGSINTTSTAGSINKTGTSGSTNTTGTAGSTNTTGTSGSTNTTANTGYTTNSATSGGTNTTSASGGTDTTVSKSPLSGGNMGNVLAALAIAQGASGAGLGGLLGGKAGSGGIDVAGLLTKAGGKLSGLLGGGLDLGGGLSIGADGSIIGGSATSAMSGVTMDPELASMLGLDDLATSAGAEALGGDALGAIDPTGVSQAIMIANKLGINSPSDAAEAVGNIVGGAGNAVSDAWESITGGCFLTTAASQYQGLPDDCDELQTLRKLRDTYMQTSEKMKAAVANYYEVAPSYVEAISKLPDVKEIYQEMWDSHILPTVKAVKEGDDEKAYQTYLGCIAYAKEKSGE